MNTAIRRTRSLGPNTLYNRDLSLMNGVADLQYLKAAHRIYTHTQANGGGTFDEDGEAIGVDGFAVGGAIDAKVLPQGTSYLDATEQIALFLHRIPRNGDGEKAFYLGTWVDDGNLYIDAVSILGDEDTAFHLARERNEIAVYDGITDECITVKDYFDHIEQEAAWAEEKEAERFALDREDVPFTY